MTDVLVVGGGLGGCMAALAATEHHSSVSVELVAPTPERFLDDSGLIDVLGYTQESDGPVARPLYKIRGLPDGHPYSRFGTRTLQNALSLFDDELGTDDGNGTPNQAFSPVQRDDGPPVQCRYHRGGTELNALVPTSVGQVRPVSRYPASIASGLVSDDRPMRIVGFDQETHLDAELAAERLGERVPYDVSATTVEFPENLGENPPALEMARALDENREMADGTPIREALAAELRPHLDVEPRLGFPAVLGVENSRTVRRDLESVLQTEVFEIPFGQSSLSGIRLRERLYECLENRDVTLHRETAVTDFESENGRIRTVETTDGQEFDASEYVLATGGLDAGGLVATRTDVTEPVFGCHVPHPERRDWWTKAEFLGDHPFAEFGVRITDGLQPRDFDGNPAFENLRAAGSVIGGFDFTTAQSKSGVALVTGYEAGRQAIENLN